MTRQRYQSEGVSSRILIAASIVLVVIALMFLACVVAFGIGSPITPRTRRAEQISYPPAAAAARATRQIAERSCSGNVCIYKSLPHQFSLTYPVSWEVREGQAGSIVSLVTPLSSAKDQFAESVNVVSELVALNTSLDAYYKASEVFLKKYFTQFKVIKTDVAVLGGAPAKVVTYQAAQGTLKLRMTQIFSIVGTKAYIVTIANTQSEPNAFFADMVAVADSFSFIHE